MEINEMELDHVMWCSKCAEVTLANNTTICPKCGDSMSEIGFVENKVKRNHGGSVRNGNCKCGNPRASKGYDDQGRQRYRTQCYKCIVAARKIAKATYCNICGITPEKSSDLHRDHIDGDRSNNTSKNIQTLCVDCHKYKTNKQKDWKKKNVE